MRTVTGGLVLALVLGVGCANRSDTAQTPGSTTSGGAPTATTSGGAGAQAAARLTAEQLEAAMKTIAGANQPMRKKIMGNMLADAAKDAQQIATQFGEVERFFAQNSKTDAVTWAQQARKAATDAAGAATAGEQMKAQASADALLGTCKQCHGMYREGDAQSGYRLKAGTI